MGTNGLLGIEMRHLAALQAIADHGSFSAAAEHLGYTQSAISQQMAALERIVGERLIERPGGPRKVSITEFGRVLLTHARVITARLASAHADIAALRAGEAGTLRVGVFQSVGAQIVPGLARRFAQTWPGVTLALSEAQTEDSLETLLSRGEVDLTFTLLPVEDDALEAVELLADPYVLAVTVDSPLAQRAEPLTLEEIAALPLVGYHRCRGQRMLERFLSSRGQTPQFVFRSEDNGMVQGVAGSGIGAALVTRLCVAPNDPCVAFIDVSDVIPPRSVGFAWYRDRYLSPSAQAFIEMAREVCDEIREEFASQPLASPQPGTARPVVAAAGAHRPARRGSSAP
jgi:DNA-binding transcriptional LysR family regulator